METFMTAGIGNHRSRCRDVRPMAYQRSNKKEEGKKRLKRNFKLSGFAFQ